MRPTTGVSKSSSGKRRATRKAWRWAHARLALEIADRIGDVFGLQMAWRAIGVGHWLRGEWHDARSALESALQLAREHRTGLQHEPDTLACLAAVELRLGEGDRARATIEAAVRAARDHGSRLAGIGANLERARILRETGGSAGIGEASASLAAAERLVEETGAESLRPQVHEERGRLADLAGNAAARDRELREAYRLYVVIGATGHAERLAKEIGA